MAFLTYRSHAGLEAEIGSPKVGPTQPQAFLVLLYVVFVVIGLSFVLMLVLLVRSGAPRACLRIPVRSPAAGYASVGFCAHKPAAVLF